MDFEELGTAKESVGNNSPVVSRFLKYTIIANRKIEEVIFNDPATIVIWGDGSKTVVKCQEGDTFDKRTGLLMCFAKRLFGDTGRYNDILNKYAPEEEPDSFVGVTD